MAIVDNWGVRGGGGEGGAGQLEANEQRGCRTANKSR